MSKPTTVVNLRTDQYEVYIGRGSKWGNPYSHMHGTKARFVVRSRNEAIQKYLDHLIETPELINSLSELKGKVLGCYCKPLPCHGDLLAMLADTLE